MWAMDARTKILLVDSVSLRELINLDRQEWEGSQVATTVNCQHSGAVARAALVAQPAW